MNEMPSIGQFRNVIRNVNHKAQFVKMGEDGLPVMNRLVSLPILTFKGTVKLHGTNASIVFTDNEYRFQSKNRILSIGNDNSGFMNYMLGEGVGIQKLTNLHQMFNEALISDIEDVESYELIVYGEWCGEGIMKGVAISQLPKMFVIFGVRLIKENEDIWVNHSLWKHIEMTNHQIYNIHRFQTFTIDIDFNKPEMVQNILGEYTEQVEKECPVGKHFGVSGIGEGIVWSCTNPYFSGYDYIMKIKGEKHSVSKVKTLAPVDIEKLKTVEEFVDRVVTENRLEQGIDYLKEMGHEVTEKSTGTFLSWIFNDVMKEEGDVVDASGLDRKDIGKPIGVRARKWYFNRINEFL